MTIDELIDSYRHGKSAADFNTICQMFEPVFRYWYRHVQRYVDMDRQSLLSDFNMILLRTLEKYDPLQKQHENGFERYLRAAAKKHSLSLRRKSASSKRYERLPQWDLVDPKSAEPFSTVDVVDALNSCVKDSLGRGLAALRLMGYSVTEIRDKMNLSDFQYRNTVGKIKDNSRLRLAMSSN